MDLVERLVASTRADSRYDPPEPVVRCAKAISFLLRPQRSTVSRLVARLVYDSFRDPAPVGLRAQDRVSRHTVYEAGNFSLDLRLEHQKGSPLATLVGQLTNRRDPDSALAEAPVLLMARQDIVAQAVYNRFGEFQMDYPLARQLRLCVAVDPSKRIELSLNRLVAAEMPKPPRMSGRRPAGQSRAKRDSQ